MAIWIKSAIFSIYRAMIRRTRLYYSKSSVRPFLLALTAGIGWLGGVISTKTCNARYL